MHLRFSVSAKYGKYYPCVKVFNWLLYVTVFSFIATDHLFQICLHQNLLLSSFCISFWNCCGYAVCSVADGNFFIYSVNNSFFCFFFFVFILNWNSFHVRLNAHYEVWSYKKSKTLKRNTKAVWKECKDKRCLLIVDWKLFRSKESIL